MDISAIMSEIDELMKKLGYEDALHLLHQAKLMYPVGTKFISIYGAEDVVTESEKTWWVHHDGVHILVQGKFEARVIYSPKDIVDSRWAKIVN